DRPRQHRRHVGFEPNACTGGGQGRRGALVARDTSVSEDRWELEDDSSTRLISLRSRDRPSDDGSQTVTLEQHVLCLRSLARELTPHQGPSRRPRDAYIKRSLTQMPWRRGFRRKE